MVARYNATGYDPAMTAQHGGAWVRYSDYAELERKLSAALARAEANAGEPAADAPKARRLAEMAMDYLHHDADTETYERHVAALTKKFARLTRGPADPAPQPSGPVGVKPLEWEERVGVDGTFDAYTSIGHYIATITDDDRGMWFVVGLTQSNYCAPDIDIVKASAQADYERRIRSALTAGKPEQAVPSGLVEFAKEMCRVGFDGGSMDGCDILDTAVKHGLCRITQYRSDMTGIVNAEYFEEGDAVYVFDGPLLPAAPTAGGGDDQ